MYDYETKPASKTPCAPFTIVLRIETNKRDTTNTKTNGSDASPTPGYPVITPNTISKYSSC